MSINRRLSWLYGLEKKGIKLGLERIQALMHCLGKPQDNYRTLHIAGTNGKGSTAKVIYTILKQAGYSVGLYTSPHLVKFNERIVVDDKEIKDKELLRLFEEINKNLKKNNLDASFFEFTTAIAFLYFKQKKVDYAVIETGLGGRLDATNIIIPVATIITSISLEHQKYLGNTLEKIAKEKAGIIKRGTPVITSATGNALKVIKDESKKRNAKLFEVHKLVKIRHNKKYLDSQTAVMVTAKNKYNISTQLLGKHQLFNIASAILTSEILGIDKKTIIKSIDKTEWPARLEIVKKTPLVILDCSHTIEGFKLLKNYIQNQLKQYDKITLVLGISDDKDMTKMVPILAGIADQLIICQAQYRGTDTKLLKKIASPHCKHIIEKRKVSAAVSYSLKQAGKNDAVIITGSLFVAGEVKEFLDSQVSLLNHLTPK